MGSFFYANFGFSISAFFCVALSLSLLICFAVLVAKLCGGGCKVQKSHTQAMQGNMLNQNNVGKKEAEA